MHLKVKRRIGKCMHATLVSTVLCMHIATSLVLFEVRFACLAREARQPHCSVRAILEGGTAEGLPGACDRGVCWIKYTMEGIPLSAIFVINSFASLLGVA